MKTQPTAVTDLHAWLKDRGLPLLTDEQWKAEVAADIASSPHPGLATSASDTSLSEWLAKVPKRISRVMRGLDGATAFQGDDAEQFFEAFMSYPSTPPFNLVLSGAASTGKSVALYSLITAVVEEGLIRDSQIISGTALDVVSQMISHLPSEKLEGRARLIDSHVRLYIFDDLESVAGNNLAIEAIRQIIRHARSEEAAVTITTRLTSQAPLESLLGAEAVATLMAGTPSGAPTTFTQQFEIQGGRHV